MRWQRLWCVASALLAPAWAVLEDEAFHIDYHQALLGRPQSHTTFFHKPSTVSNASLLYTLSDKAVVGAVNPRDGSLLWRQSLTPTPADNATSAFLVGNHGGGQVISAYERTISAWGGQDGRLVWTYELPAPLAVLGLQAVPPWAPMVLWVMSCCCRLPPTAVYQAS